MHTLSPSRSDNDIRFENAINAHRGELLGYARHCLGEHASEAEDAVQDAFIALWLVIANVPDAAIRPFLYTGVKWRNIDILKKRGRHVFMEQGFFDKELAKDADTPGIDPWHREAFDLVFSGDSAPGSKVEAPPSSLCTPASPCYSVPDAAPSSGSKQALDTALSQLSGEDRQIITWYRFDDFSFEEIAQLLAVCTRTARRRLRNAEARLLVLILAIDP